MSSQPRIPSVGLQHQRAAPKHFCLSWRDAPAILLTQHNESRGSFRSAWLGQTEGKATLNLRRFQTGTILKEKNPARTVIWMGNWFVVLIGHKLMKSYVSVNVCKDRDLLNPCMNIDSTPTRHPALFLLSQTRSLRELADQLGNKRGRPPGNGVLTICRGPARASCKLPTRHHGTQSWNTTKSI